MVERFLENQTKELELRAQELTLQKQKDANAFEFGKEALTVKATDRKDQRDHEKCQRKHSYFFAGFVTLVVAAVILYSLFTGKEAFALEIVKALVFILTGGAGGYGLAKASAAKHKGKDESSGS